MKAEIMQINDSIKDISVKLKRIYRDLHQIPELAFKEYKTAEYIQHTLEEENFSNIHSEIGSTGVTATVGKGKPIVAIRADMDALPIEEETNLPYSSKHIGLMHACGHDAHMAAVLGAGMILKHVVNELPGAVKFIFQPAEETPPGGAQEMIKANILNKELKTIIALHTEPHLPSGTIGVKDGAIMAAADMFSITLIGSGGHGAMPHQTRDVIVAGSYLVQAIQTVISRMVNPLQPAVVTVGSFNAGTKANIIAGKAELKGTVRTLDPKLRESMPKLIERVINGVCNSHGVQYTFNYDWGYPPVINDATAVKTLREAAKKTIGIENVINVDSPSMGGEDFSYYLERIPGVYFYLGVGKRNETDIKPWHHPCYQIDEDALLVGAKVLAQTTLDVLRSENSGPK